MTEIQHIVLRSDGVARYERIRQNGRGDEKVVGEREAPIAALFPGSGEPICYPPRCRFFVSARGRTVVVLEEPPRPRNIEWKTQFDKYQQMHTMLADKRVARELGIPHQELLAQLKHRVTFTLAFPYIVKIFQCENDAIMTGYCFYRTEPLRTSRDTLSYSNLPNVHPDARMCFGGGFGYASGAPTLALQLEYAEQLFWGTAWNGDLITHFEDAARRIAEVATPWHWAHATAQDPRFVLRVPWAAHAGTVEEWIANLLQAQESGIQLFGNLVERLHMVADAMVPVAPGMEASVEGRIVLVDDILTVGERVVIAPGTFPAFSAGGTLTITRFSEERGGMRVAEFADGANPLAIIMDGMLVEGVQRVDTSAPIVLNGVLVGRRTIVRVTDADAWPRLRPVQLIAQACRTAIGDVCASFRGHTIAIVIGHGDALLPGLTAEPAEEVDARGYCSADHVHIAGREVRVGQRVFDGRQQEQLCVRTIAAFLPLQPHDCCRRAMDTDDILLTLEEEFHPGTPNPHMVVEPDGGVAEIRCGATVLRVGDHMLWGGRPVTMMELTPPIGEEHHVYARFGSMWVCVGSTARLSAAIRPLPDVRMCGDGVSCAVRDEMFSPGTYAARGTSGCVDVTTFIPDGPHGARAMLADGHSIPFITQGVPCREWIHVERSHDVAGVTIVSGMELRLTRTIRRVARKGDVFTVHSIEQTPVGARIIFTDGRAMLAIRENLLCFVWKDGMVWRPFADNPDGYPKVAAEGLPGKGLYSGMQVRYLGGDSGTRFLRARTLDEARTVRAVVRDSFWERPFRIVRHVEFNRHFAGLWDDYGCGIRGSCLALDGVPRIETSGFSRAFLDPLQVRVVGRGAHAGSDARGNLLVTGDRVRVIAHGLDKHATLAAQEYVALGGEFVVAHVGFHPCGNAWCYLAAGADIAGRRLHRETWGYAALPKDIRSDSRWWAAITTVRSASCERIA